MKLKLVVFVAMLAAMLLVLTSCSFLTGGIVTADACSSLEGAEKDNCYFESQQCSKIKSTQFRDTCVAELAKLKGDIKVCDLIVTSKTKGFCQQQIAVEQDNFDLCKEIGDESWQDNCYYKLALNQKDAGKCAYISEVS